MFMIILGKLFTSFLSLLVYACIEIVNSSGQTIIKHRQTKDLIYIK